MPDASSSSSRGRGALRACLVLLLACSAPDGTGLFRSLSPSSAGGSTATVGGSGGVSGASAGMPVSAGSGGRVGEGQGGSLALSGAGGAAGTPTLGETLEGGAEEELDAGAAPDAGRVEDAALPPDPCPGGGPEVCDGRDNDCDGEVDPGQTCPAACRGFALDDAGYMFCATAVDRAGALARCAAQGMKLAWLETPAENAAVLSSIAGLELPGAADELIVQIGSTDVTAEGEWFWVGVGGARVGFQFWRGNAATDDDADVVNGASANWAPTEPNDTDNEDCGVMSITGSEFRAPGEWDDRACSVVFPFVCEEP